MQEINAPLLTETMTWINTNPSHHNQSSWHCGTSHCFFGVAEMLGTKLSPFECFVGADKTFENAKKLLNLTDAQASYISKGSLSRGQLNEIVKTWTIPDFISSDKIAIALSPFPLSIDLITELAHDSDEDVRRAIANNQKQLIS
jgi:hypothetical protein